MKTGLVIFIIILFCYIFTVQKTTTKIDAYADIMDNYTHMYGTPSMGYTIPLTIEYIQNDTVYLVTTEIEKSQTQTTK